MGGFFKGDFGQYFTPRELIGFAVEVLNPGRDHFVQSKSALSALPRAA
jgi:type I restriction enzyme M protein